MGVLLKVIITAILIVSLACFCYADEELTLVDVIEYPDLDIYKIYSVNNVGDFNDDSYDDILVGIEAIQDSDWLEVAYLYYGGPDFDTQPDLIFYGDQESDMEANGFGYSSCRLNDFNGDGIDDIAISEPARGAYVGRINIYFGSLEPDTISDLRLYGEYSRDFLGKVLFPGDYNGDGLGDLFVSANGNWVGVRLLIYTGSQLPDSEYDFIIDYSEDEGEDAPSIFGGLDLNNDGIDDFGWSRVASDIHRLIFLGDEYLDPEPDVEFSRPATPIYYPGDISNDGIADFVRLYNDYDYYLCLGGNPLDTIPDYYLCANCYIGHSSYVCEISSGNRKLVTDNTVANKLILYNTGVPFDTIPYAVCNYDVTGLSDSPVYIGDINDDGNAEFALKIEADSVHWQVNLYSIITTGIDEKHDNLLPEDKAILSCYPNPFNSSTVISYSSEGGGDIGIYDITGRLVRKYATGDIKEGKITWDGTNADCQKVSSGLYFIKLSNSQRSVSTKLVFMK